MSVSKRWMGFGFSLTLAVGLLALSLMLMTSLAHAQAGSISGTVTYYGGITSTHQIYVAVFTRTNQPPLPGVGDDLSSPGGSYTVSGLDDGDYYVNAFLDANDSGGGLPDPDEPLGWYDPNGDGDPDAVTVAGGAATGIDIVMGGPWLSLGGPITPCDIDVDLQNLDKLFVAADCGGGWVTSNGGDTWTQLSDVADCMGAFAINPEDPNIVYGGEYNDNRGAVIRSEDGGLTFESVYTATFIMPDGSGGNEAIHALAIAPTMSSTVYAAGQDNPAGQDGYAVIVRSLNDGASWTEVFSLPSESEVVALAINPANDDTVYASGQDCSGPDCAGFIYRTTDGSDNWTQVLTTAFTVRSIVVDYQEPDILYAADDILAPGDEGYRVYKSTDGGDNWDIVLRPPWEPDGGLSGNLLAIDPCTPTHVYVGGYGFVGETADGGQTWSSVDDPLDRGTPNEDIRALTVDNGTVTQTLYAGFSGVWSYIRQSPCYSQPPPSWLIYLPIIMKNY